MNARATVIFRDFAPQHISVLLWATAKLGHNPGPHLLTAAISTATAEMPNFNPQNVANSLWAYATLGFYPGHAFMAAAASRQLSDMQVRQLAHKGNPSSSDCCSLRASAWLCRLHHSNFGRLVQFRQLAADSSFHRACLACISAFD